MRDRVDVPIALDGSIRGRRLRHPQCAQAERHRRSRQRHHHDEQHGESSLGLAAHFHVNVALANTVHCDADLPWLSGGSTHDIMAGLGVELRDGVSTVTAPDGPGLGWLWMRTTWSGSA